jgi:hypothetical protein
MDGVMDERRTARRYDLTLPVIVRVPTENSLVRQEGSTRDISARGLYFVVDQNLEPGAELDISVTLPETVTHGSEVCVKALGRVVRVECRIEDQTPRTGIAAMIERYDIIRVEAARG